LCEDAVEALIARSRKHRSKGETRRAIVLLRRACTLDERRARTWTLLGALLVKSGLREEAIAALKQARWLRMRAGEHGRAAATEALIHRLHEHDAA
jgi:Flp pilus assembly protein TadD